MVNGAMNSGVRAAEWALEKIQSSDGLSERTIVIIGAGAAGIAAAHHLLQHDRNLRIVLLEARDRIGGRIHTVQIGGHPVDAGATWLHHFQRNHLSDLAKQRFTPVQSDFNNPLNAAKDGSSDAIREMINNLEREAQRAVAEYGDDMPLSTALQEYLQSLRPSDRRKALMALEEFRADSGIDYSMISGKYAMVEQSRRSIYPSNLSPSFELGVGCGDCYLKEGYSALLEHFLADDIDLQLSTPVLEINWSDRKEIIVYTEKEELRGQLCICTIPISLLQANTPRIEPPLPLAQQRALSRMKISTCDKVLR